MGPARGRPHRLARLSPLGRRALHETTGLGPAVCVVCVVCAAAGIRAGPESAGTFPRDSGPLPRLEGEAAGGRLRWTGVAGFRFDLGGSAIAFDPFVTRPRIREALFGRPASDAALVAERFSRLDAVFVGHTHYDHAMDLPAVAEASPDALIYGSATTVELCRRLGVSKSRLRVAEDGDRYEVGPFAVEAIASEHGIVPVVRHVDRIELSPRGVPRTPFRYPRGRVLAWRLSGGGRTIHVQGSAGIDQAALERQEPADVLIACLAARKGTPRYLERLAECLRPALLVPCHHDDFFRGIAEAPRPIATLRWKAFEAEAAELRRLFGTRLWCPPFDETVDW